MDSGKILPDDGKSKKDAGQSLVEFMLLLLVVVTLSFGFIKISNGNLGRIWQTYVRLIVDDPSQNGALTITN